MSELKLLDRTDFEVLFLKRFVVELNNSRIDLQESFELILEKNKHDLIFKIIKNTTIEQDTQLSDTLVTLIGSTIGSRNEKESLIINFLRDCVYKVINNIKFITENTVKNKISNKIKEVTVYAKPLTFYLFDND